MHNRHYSSSHLDERLDQVGHGFQKDPFPGICPYHGDCLEGLAAGPALEKRWGQRAETLPDTHPAWELEAEYIAWALVNLIYAYSPMRIVLGGGVPEHPGLHTSIRRKVQQLINGYVNSPMVLEKINSYIIPPLWEAVQVSSAQLQWQLMNTGMHKTLNLETFRKEP